MQHHAKILRTHLEAAAICRQTEFGATSAEYIEAERLVLGLRVIPELRAGRRQQNWVLKLHAYEEFAELNSRAPRENTRNRAALPAPERRMAEWARYQRRLEYELCRFQKIRLDVSPSFEWDPQQAAWDARSLSCIRHVSTTGQLPHLNVTDPAEFANARWLGRQLRHLEVGTLLPDRADRLKELLETFKDEL